MARGNVSGFRLNEDDIPIVLGMIARGDRRHDIAAWFGVNQGRIKGAEDGQYGTPTAAPEQRLPPQGAPGVKGKRLRAAAGEIGKLLKGGNVSDAHALLEKAVCKYDVNEL